MGLRVLVVDDNQDSADTLAVLLRLGGHQADIAYNGHVALLMAEKHPPDVILLDLAMPRMTGYSVAQALRQRPETKDALIIAVTGYGQDADRQKCIEAGFDLHLLKPLQTEKLLALFRGDPSLLLARSQ